MNRIEEVQTKYWAYEILSGGNKEEAAMLASALSTSTISLIKILGSGLALFSFPGQVNSKRVKFPLISHFLFNCMLL